MWNVVRTSVSPNDAVDLQTVSRIVMQQYRRAAEAHDAVGYLFLSIDP